MKLEIRASANTGVIVWTDVDEVRGIDGLLRVTIATGRTGYRIVSYDALRRPDEELRRVIAGGQWDEVK